MIGTLRPQPALQNLKAYAVPKHPAPIDLPLHGNEGPLPEAALWDAALAKDPELLRRYPNPHPLEATLAARLGLEASQVLVTAGADEALDRAFRAFVSPGDRVLMPTPTFAMLPHYAALAHAVVESPDWPAEDFPFEETRAWLATKPRLLTLVTPNNPTGAVIACAQLLELAQMAPETLICVDCAYVEMADSDPTQALLQLPNVCVFRTLSKAWGLAGLRVGYVLGSPQVIQWLRAAGSPYSVSGPSLALAHYQVTHHEAAMKAYVAWVKQAREALETCLRACGASVVTGQSNFVFARAPNAAWAVWLRDGLAALGIGIRAFPEDPKLADGVRITCPEDEASLSRVVRAIQAVWKPKYFLEDAETLTEGQAQSWVLVRSESEVRHVRALGAVPVALLQPGQDSHALLAAGVARVVPDLESLKRGLG